MISVPRGKDDLSLYRGIPSPLTLAPWGFGQLLPAVSFSSCEFCNEQRNVLSVSLHPFIFRKRHWSTRYTQFAMILAGVLLGQIPCLYAPFGANTAAKNPVTSRLQGFLFCPKRAAPSRLRNASLLPRIYGISPVVYESRGTMTPLGSAAVSVNASVSRKRTSAAAKSPVKASSVPISSKPKPSPR